MATKKKAAPKRKTASKATARKSASVPSATEEEIVQRLATPVDITPANRKKPDYREIDVRAMTAGTYGGKRRKAGDVFRMGLTGVGHLPSWVEAA